MKALTKIKTCTWIYFVLVFLTLITYVISRAGYSGLTVSLMVLAIALFKGQLIGNYFMGLSRVRGPWRWVIFIWLLIPGSLIVTAFTLAS